MTAEKFVFGTPEAVTPCRFKPDSKIPVEKKPTSAWADLEFFETDVGCRVEFPLQEGTHIFGFGLQMHRFDFTAGKAALRPNADALSPSGDSHAPVPFFVTNRGWGIYVDTARQAVFYCGYRRKGGSRTVQRREIGISTEELYSAKELTGDTVMIIDIPVAKGVTLYRFQGATTGEAVAGYNLFSGGGAMPPLWGLGVFYRCYSRYTQIQVLETAAAIRRDHIPCSIIGLEPGWQTRSYSCSFEFDPERFPDPAAMTAALREAGFHINLWEHAYVHPESPLYESLYPFSGDFLVWDGLVPDFAEEEAVRLFAGYHREQFVEKEIDGFKLDECDGSDFTGSWSFPDTAVFPSGIPGDQMHSLYGTLYAKAILSALGSGRTWSQVRNMGACAASYPFHLYSDLYEHKAFIRGMASAGLSGLLWVPEVREGRNKQDFIRRLETVVFSPAAMINAWYLDHFPWLDFDCTNEVRHLLELRMRLIPYLYSAFYTYYTTGRAPIRPLVADYSEDSATYPVDDQFLVGDCLLIAPMTAEQQGRQVYLPKGRWVDFYTEDCYEGGRCVDFSSERMPVLVRDGSILPLAEPVEQLDKDTLFSLTLLCYGNTEGCRFPLIVDDGVTAEASYKVLPVDDTGYLENNPRYTIAAVHHVGAQ